MKNSADLGGCYPPRPSASMVNTLLYLQNSSYPTQPHSIIAKYSVISKNAQMLDYTFECRPPGTEHNMLIYTNLTTATISLEILVLATPDIEKSKHLWQVLFL